MTTYFNISGMDLPSSIKSDMNTIMKRKLGITENITIPPDEWASFITYMKPLPEKTASGAIAHFSDGADTVPVNSCKVTFTPKQEGTGDPSPSNVRNISGFSSLDFSQTGANIWGGDTLLQNFINANITNFVYDTTLKTLRYGAPQISGKVIKTLPFKENTAYTFVVTAENSNNTTHTNLIFRYTDGTYKTIQAPQSIQNTKTTFVVTSANNKTIKSIEGANYSGNATLYYDECGIFEGTLTAQDFEAYKGNLISARLPIGKNLVDVEGRTITSQTTVMSATTFEAGTYILSAHVKNNGTIRGNIRVAKSGSTVAEIQCLEGEDERKSSSSFTLSERAELTILCNGQSAGYNFTFSDLMLEEGSSATSYVPYRTWYGGEIDLVNKVFKAKYVSVGGGWVQYKQNNGFKAYQYYGVPLRDINVRALCNMLDEFGSFNSDNMTKNIIQLPTSAVPNTYCALDENADIKALELVYALATPVEYSLTDEEIAEILTYYGVNNFFSDMETGIVDLSYRADPTLATQ